MRTETAWRLRLSLRDVRVMLDGKTSYTPFSQGDAAFLQSHLFLTECDNLLYIKHVHGVTANTTTTFGLVWHLQSDKRAARRHGGHRYEVGEGCASPGRRGSDLLRRVDGYGVCQAFANEEGRVCDRVEGRIAGLCVLTECGNLLSNDTARMSR
jgi:hypothetical protein